VGANEHAPVAFGTVRFEFAHAALGNEALRERVRMVPIDRITPNPHNSRTHPPKQIRQIADSIHAFSFRSPLLVDEDLNVIACHGRFAATPALGMSEIPVLVWSGLSAAKRCALAIADNRIAEGAGWDRRRLAIEIPELTELLSLEQLDISILGFQPIEIEQIRLEPEAPTRVSREAARSHHDIEPAWGEKATVSRSGDLWNLDTHKLLCGDARSADDLKLLMGADRADMAFIDLGGGKRAGDAEDEVTRVLDAAAVVSREGAINFVCTNWAGVGELAATAKEAGRRVLDVVARVTPEPSQGAMYRDQYEPIGVLEIGSSERRCATQERRALSRSRSWRTRSRTARVATTSFSIRPAAPESRSWPRRGLAGARAASNGNRGSSTSRSAGGRRRRVGRHSTRSRLPFNSVDARRSRKHDGWEQ
jgi:ParB-like nuclease domain